MISSKNGLDSPPSVVLILLHLGPGIVFTLVFLVMSNLLARYGLSSYLILMIAIPLCLVPIELGVIFLWMMKSAGSRSISHAVGFLQKGTVADYTILPLVLFVFCTILTIPTIPITQFLESHLPKSLPTWVISQEAVRELASVSDAERTIIFILAVFSSGFAAPIAEEVYFRGFLLSRAQRWGKLAPVVNSLLFGIYHFYSPWNVVAIFLKFLPIAYVVSIKKNVRISVLTHCLFNLVNVLLLFSGSRVAS